MTDPAADLPQAARAAIEVLLARLASDPRAPSSVREPGEARDVHLADSLSGLEVPDLAAAEAIADVGSGAGFPGAVLAAAVPAARIDLIEASSRKCDYVREALAEAGIANATVVCARSEEWAAELPPAGGREAYDAVTMRAVGSLATSSELASPLLREGGVLVVWKGGRRPEEESELARGASRLAIEPVEVRAVRPYAGSRERHLHVLRKSGPTPPELPRRPGLASKRPLGS